MYVLKTDHIFWFFEERLLWVS